VKGFVESADFKGVSGWAFDPARPDESVEIEVFDGDRFLLRARADEERRDLAAAGYGTGRHGFRVRLPDGLLPASRHLVRVRFAGTSLDVAGSPRLLEAEGGYRGTRLAEFTREYVSQEIASARVAGDLAPAVGFVLQQLDELLEARARLGEATGSVDTGFDPGNALRNLLGDLRDAYPPITLIRPARPDLTILLPAYNQFDDVYAAIRSIAGHETRFAVEVVVVDAGSEDLLMLASLAFPNGVKLFRTRSRETWTNAVRAGMALVSSPVVWVVDPGLSLALGAVDAVMGCLERDPTIGIVSPVIGDTHNRVIEAGKSLSDLGELSADAVGLDIDSPLVTVTRDAAVASHQAMVFRRAVWQRLKGYDREFDPAGHHEADFTRRANEAGWRSVVAGHARLVARGGVAERWRARWPVDNHLRLFLDRWVRPDGGVEPDGLAPTGETSTVKALSRRPAGHRSTLTRIGKGRSVLFIDDHVPTPDRDAGSRVIVDHMKALTRLGYDVCFMPNITASRSEPQTSNLEDDGILCLLAPYVRDLRDAVALHGRPFDVVYLHRYTTAIRQFDAIRALMPDARTILNVADLHHLRFQREAELTGDDAALRAAAEVQLDEIAALGRADDVIVHSPVEEALLRERHGLGSVHVVPWSLPVAEPVTNWEKKIDLAFIGGFRHRPNADAAEWILAQIMPRLSQRLPSVRCRFIGAEIPEGFGQGHECVVVDGWVPDLRQALAPVRMTLAPLRFGAGIKGKVIESWARGIPCLMSSIAAEGQAVDELPFQTVHDDPDALVSAIVELFIDEAKLTLLSAAGQKIVANRFSQEAVENSFFRLLSDKGNVERQLSVRS
jgi:GT2 family glycosyltransferase/glycosyltransferase involved in cell wall biosynthesis